MRQAHRVLAPGGYLWIAEVRSRIEKGEDGEDDVTKALLRSLKVRAFEHPHPLCSRQVCGWPSDNRVLSVWKMRDIVHVARAGRLVWAGRAEDGVQVRGAQLVQ